MNVVGLQHVALPGGASILCVQMQGQHPQLWVLCDPDAPKETSAIAIYGTGNPLPNAPGRYIDTFQMHGGSLVWHAFEVAL